MGFLNDEDHQDRVAQQDVHNGCINLNIILMLALVAQKISYKLIDIYIRLYLV
jgi:hypothetical protein